MGQVGGLWAVELCSFHLVPHQGPPSTCWERVELGKGKGPKLKANGAGEELKQGLGPTQSPRGAQAVKEQQRSSLCPHQHIVKPTSPPTTPLIC